MKLPSLKLNFVTIFLVVGILVLLFLTVNCSITQNEKNAELYNLTKEYETVANQGAVLQIEIDKKSDFFSVEQYASQKLGMHKLEKYQVQYIRQDIADSSELLYSEEEEDFFGQVAKAFSVITDFFRN